MNWKQIVGQRLPRLSLPPAREAEILQELAQLLEDNYADARANGTAHAEAVALAEAQLPAGEALAKWIEQAEQPFAAQVPPPLRAQHLQDQLLRSRRGALMNSFLQDVKYAVRMLTKSPAFTIVAVLTLALGIGANTAIFTVVNEALLRPRPGIGDPATLVDIGRTDQDRGFDNMSYPNFRDARERTTTLSGMAGMMFEPRPMSMGTTAGSERIFVNLVSGNYFEVLQAKPHAGRFFLPEEDRTPGSHPVVVLSYAYWQQRFNGDPKMLGSAIKLNGLNYTVVGVAAREFHGTTPIAVNAWVPMMMGSQVVVSRSLLECRECSFMVAIGRLKPGNTLQQARAEFAAISANLQREYPKENKGRGLAVSESSLLPGEVQQIVGGFLALLMVIVGLVLVIAAVNVAGMMLVRGVARRREIAVRLAIGAGRGQIMRQMITEGVMLFVAGGTLGLAIAMRMRDALIRMLPSLPVPVSFDLSLDWRVLAFALLLSLFAGIAASLLPALQSSRLDLVTTLKDDSHMSGDRKLRLRNALVLGQVSLSLVLLICAGLFLRALNRAATVDPGFAMANLQVLSIDLSLAGYKDADGIEFAHRFEERVRSLPAVQSAAWAWSVPLDGGGRGLGAFQTPGIHAPDGSEYWDFDWSVVTPGYFATMKIPLLRGRDFAAADNAAGTRVAIINERAARAIWPDQDPIGRKFRNGDPRDPASMTEIEIIGVARDQKYRSLGDQPRNFVFLPLRQQYIANLGFMVRTENPATAIPGIRSALLEMNPNLPLLGVISMEEYAAVSMLPQRIASWVAGSLGMLGLLLVGLGVYGVTAFSVEQRTREIGVRMALGAARGDVMRMVLAQGLRLAGWGTVIGLAISAAASQALNSFLYGISAWDPLTFVTVAGMVLGVAALATLLPARRATRVDPLVALRYE